MGHVWRRAKDGRWPQAPCREMSLVRMASFAGPLLMSKKDRQGTAGQAGTIGRQSMCMLG